jgi:serine/threonine protein kinase/Tfp pilus assembly protein PilF
MNEKPKNIKTIFAEALEKETPKEQAAYLDKACGNDADLRSKVEELLKSHDQAGSFLEVDDLNPQITLNQAPLSEREGTVIGPYKLLEKIGEGGMAMVYMAEQTEPLRRRVALKIIKLGMDTRGVIARFEAERQALAMMDHPNVAKVLDAGATETGRPYFVMELVKGVSITEYCDKNRLSTKERMALFVPVCNAVEHAHQKGIIHRDIKPSNVMVSLHDGKPVPKVIDFGIAKATCLELTEKTLFTRYAQMIGTPEYMSPEQAEFSGLDVDTRTDIYSLGVLLYELLTGAPPFDPKTMRSGAIGEIQRIIREDEPPRPSTLLSTFEDAGKKAAESRRTDVATLAKNLNKELEWIPLKAMRKDRTRRYRSACELADDVQNYLKDEPLIAGPESAMYRIAKFAHRKRAMVAGVAAVAAMLIISAAVSLVFGVRESRARAEAERHARISQAVSDFLRDDLLGSADPWSGRTEGVSVISFLDAASKQLEGKFADEPLIEASIRFTIGRTFWHLGRYKEAVEHLERSLKIRRDKLGNEDFDTLLCMRELGWVYRHLSKYDRAEPMLVEALEGMKRTLKEEDGSLLYCMGWLSWLYIQQGRFEEAEQLQAEGLEIIQRKLGAEHPWVPSFMYSIGYIYRCQQRYDEAEKLMTEALDISRRTRGDLSIETLNIIAVLGDLYQNQERYQDAERYLTEALQGRRKVLGEEHPDTFITMDSLGWLYRTQGKLEQAEQLLAECYLKSREALGRGHERTLNSMLRLAVVHQEQERYEQAEELIKEALRISRQKGAEGDVMTAWSLKILGELYVVLKKYDQAQSYLNEALEIRRRVLGEEYPDTLESMGDVALLYYKRGKIDEAEAFGVEALQIMRRALGEDNPITLGLTHDLGWWYLSIGRHTEAEMLLNKALEGRRRILGENHQDTQVSMVAVDFQQGRYDKAEPILLKVLEHERRIDGLDNPFTLFSIRNLATLYHKQGRYDKAEPLLIEFLENSQRVLSKGHPDTAAAMNELIKLYEAWEKPEKAQEWRAKLNAGQDK